MPSESETHLDGRSDAAIPPVRPQPAGQLAYEAMLRLQAARVHMESAVRSDLGITFVEATVLQSLILERRSIGDLARTTGIGRSSVSMAVRRLADRGFIVRESEGARTMLDLTPSIRRQLVDALHAPLHHAIAEWLGTFDDPPSENRTADLLQRIASSFDHKREHRAARCAAEQLHGALIRGDADSTFALVRTLVTEGDPVPAYEALSDALETIKHEHAAGSVGIADQQIATVTAFGVTERLRALTRHARPSGLVAIVASLTSEPHDLALLMVIGELERAGWTAQPVGGSLDDDDLVSVSARMYADAIVIHTSDATHEQHAQVLARRLTAATRAHVVVLPSGGLASLRGIVEGIATSIARAA